MKSILLPIFVLSISIGCSFGQSETASYQKHIGFNTNIIFNGIFQSGATPFAFMYKKQMNEHQALRLGSAIYFNIEDTNQGTQKQSQRSFEFQFSVGKEFQSAISERWVWYRGGDIIPFYSTSINEQYSSGGSLDFKSSQNRYGLSLRPFLGIRFNITSRLYLSTEASLQMSYRKQDLTNMQGGLFIESNSNKFSFDINPATSIYFFYLF